jgi:predicted ester cyclase
MSEDIKALFRRIPEEVVCRGRLDLIDQLIAADVREHGDLPPGVPPGREGLRAIATALRAAFPDLTCTIDLQVAEGDLLASKITYSGTMQGPLWGNPPTGKRATWTESHFIRARDGKATDHWGDVDVLAMLRQLGLAPMPPVAATRS